MSTTLAVVSRSKPADQRAPPLATCLTPPRAPCSSDSPSQSLETFAVCPVEAAMPRWIVPLLDHHFSRALLLALFRLFPRGCPRGRLRRPRFCREGHSQELLGVPIRGKESYMR